jgi:hypothetical protein
MAGWSGAIHCCDDSLSPAVEPTIYTFKRGQDPANPEHAGSN